MSYETIDTSEIISAFRKHVPGVFVRDYRSNKGFIVIARQLRKIHDHSKNTEIETVHETLCNLPEGQMTKASFMRGKAIVRPGWAIEMRKAARFLSPAQKRSIEKDLHVPVFRS